MLIADTHVHMYPVYRAANAFRAAHRNLQHCGHGSPFDAALFLTERRDCSFFADLHSGRNIPNGLVAEKDGSNESLLVGDAEHSFRIRLFQGYQTVTRENIEILSLVATARAPDGMPSGDTLKAIRDTGGIPVLSWSPGKWLFDRGRIVRSLIESNDGQPLLVGDTAMRPRGFPRPAPMKFAGRHGIPVVAGTDPLPFTGDEAMIGTYGISSSAFAPDRPVDSARDLLLRGEFIVCGRRNNAKTSVRRWNRNRCVRKS